MESAGSTWFTDDQIEAANDYVCGTMTVEGALSERQNICPFLIAPINAEKKASVLFMLMDISA